MPIHLSFVRSGLAVLVACVLGGCADSTSRVPPGAGGASGSLVGNLAPDFHTTPVVGPKATIALRGLRGDVVLLDFWGTFCEPCKKSFPKLEELHRRYAASGLHVIGISEDEEDDKGKIPPFAESYGARFPLAWDANKAIAKLYNPETMPSSFLIDRRGLVRFVHVGFHDGEELALEEEIKDLLKQ
jgi:cytochrome c biogenesis protein CcmG, thiol:disulfide interchange protein DsbE